MYHLVIVLCVRSMCTVYIVASILEPWEILESLAFRWLIQARLRPATRLHEFYHIPGPQQHVKALPLALTLQRPIGIGTNIMRTLGCPYLGVGLNYCSQNGRGFKHGPVMTGAPIHKDP